MVFAGGKHSTGMHSCCDYFLSAWNCQIETLLLNIKLLPHNIMWYRKKVWYQEITLLVSRGFTVGFTWFHWLQWYHIFCWPGFIDLRVQIHFQLLAPANEVWGRVMFLHLSVSHSVHRGGVSLTETPLDRDLPPQLVKSGQYVSYWNAFLFSTVFVLDPLKYLYF